MDMRSGIGRPIDPSYRSNMFILAVTPAAGIIAGILTLIAGDGWGDAVRNGFFGGGASFLAWAIGREIDPDCPVSAGAAAVAAPFALLAGDPALGQLFAVLLMTRLVVRSTGLFPMPGDLVVYVALMIYVATTDGGLAVALVGAAALAADIRLPGEAPPRQAVAALVAAAGAAVAAALTDGIAIDPLRPSGGLWVLLGVAVLGGLLVLRPSAVTARADLRDQRLSPVRLKASRFTALAAGLAGFAWLGGPSLAGLAPMWVAMAAALVIGFVPLGASAREE